MSIKPHHCDFEGCGQRFKIAGNLKSHKAHVHDIDVTWHHCDFEGCEKKFKTKGSLKKHKAYVHDIDVTWHHCDFEGCEKKFKTTEDLKLHKAYVHDIDVTWYHCDFEGCGQRFKIAGNLKRHKAYVHDIDVTWHDCDFEGCEERFKTAGDLKRHKAFVHDIDVTWHHCDFEGCGQKFKIVGKLKRHKAYVHDIGTHKCEFCYSNRNSHISYTDNTGSHKICRKCYKKATGKESRVEHTWSDYTDKELGTEYLSSSDKSLKSNGGCSLYRPDKLYIGIDRVEIDECDEHQHKRVNGDYTCDEKRISDIYDEYGINGKDLSVIRWNPDKYKVPHGYTTTPRQQRLKLFVELKKKLRTKNLTDKIHIYYMFYDMDNPRISKRIPHTMIYNEADINKI